MALIQNPIIGRAKKSAGGMVFATVHGKNVMRSKPFSYNTPDTDEHRKRTGKFKAGNELASKVKSYARGFFESQPVGRSAYAAMSSQIQKSFRYVNNVLTFNPFEIEMGKGSLPIIRGNNVNRVDNTHVQVEWDPNLTDPDETNDDKVSIVITNSDGTKAARIDTNVIRSVDHVQVAIPEYFADDAIYISTPIFTSPSGMLKSAFYLSDIEQPEPTV
jgi:hypothetical protein